MNADARMTSRSGLDDLRVAIDSLGDPDRAAGMSRYFKTGPGEYAEGDVFAGVTMPQLRRVIRGASLSVDQVSALLTDRVHEHRMAAVLLMVEAYAKAAASSDERGRQAVCAAYLAGRAHIDNWDLVDASSEFVLGPEWRAQGSAGRRDRLALVRSTSLWDRRIAVLSTFHDIKLGDGGPALEVCALLLGDQEDLIHKATGWMLREVGKRVGRPELLTFLDEHAAVMPRTMLRYAIEHLDAAQRRHYLGARSALDPA